jgi:hypothetical protein
MEGKVYVLPTVESEISKTRALFLARLT